MFSSLLRDLRIEVLVFFEFLAQGMRVNFHGPPQARLMGRGYFYSRPTQTRFPFEKEFFFYKTLYPHQFFYPLPFGEGVLIAL